MLKSISSISQRRLFYYLMVNVFVLSKLVNSKANAERIRRVEDCFGGAGQVHLILILFTFFWVNNLWADLPTATPNYLVPEELPFCSAQYRIPIEAKKARA